jgi:hypothetical protein
LHSPLTHMLRWSHTGSQLVAMQWPPWHCSLDLQAMPQVPQWSWLEVTSKQPPGSAALAPQQLSGGTVQARLLPGH